MDLVGAVIGLIPMILSLSVHEYAHAWSAARLGDDTAARMGRLTLNPAAHIDPIGTILLPVMLTANGYPAFGWARPVPIDPTRFRRGVSMGRGMAISASAGPLSNLLLALVATVLLGVLVRLNLDGAGSAPDVQLRERFELVAAAITSVPGLRFLFVAIQLNLVLALFNFIPVPPLDGSRVVAWLIPTRLRQGWHNVERFAPLLLIPVFLYGGRLIAGPLQAVSSVLLRLIMVIVFGDSPK
jgi:Zn-dependent protease